VEIDLFQDGGQIKIKNNVLAFLWNFFISKEAVTAERRYEKERHSVKLHACKLHLVQGRICSLFSLPSPSPLTPASNKCDKGGQLRLFPPPPSPTHPPLLNLNSFQRPRPKARMASI
jgi:hypothetical protein